MKLLHKYLAWSIGIWLVLICASGSILLFKNDLLPFMYKDLSLAQEQYVLANQTSKQNQIKNTEILARVTAQFDQVEHYRYVIYASNKAPWHTVVDEQDTHHYYDLTGNKLLSRSHNGDWLEWLRQFHLHLLLHEFGEDVLGVLSIIASVLVIAGLAVWWPKRFNKRLFVLPTRGGHAKTYRQWHTVIGSLSFPLLAVVLFTSIGLLYFSSLQTFIKNVLDEKPVAATTFAVSPSKQKIDMDTATITTNWLRAYDEVLQKLPGAKFRLVSLQQDQTKLISLRMKFEQEWHPNGRTRVYFHPQTGNVVKTYSALNMGAAESVMNLLYPVHTAAVGGYWWLIILAMVGISPLALMYCGVRLSWFNKQR